MQPRKLPARVPPRPLPTPRPPARPKPVAAAVAAPRPPNRSRELNCGTPAGWLHVRPRTLSVPRDEPQPIELYAVIGTWLEGDIIDATVKACFANGCSKVFIVDNDSPDDTCALAVRAGAVIAHTYKTPYYDEDLRLLLMNQVMATETVKAGVPDLWWLSLDADEFPVGPAGEPVRDYLSRLPRAINSVGAFAVDLYPTAAPYYTRGLHPADCMSMGTRRGHGKHVFCERAHWKHLLLRARDGVYALAQSRGSHGPYVLPHAKQPSVEVYEPTDEVIIFHAPLREKEVAYARLDALCRAQPELGGKHRSSGDDLATRGNGAIKRYRCLEAIYNGWWDRVEMPHSQQYGRDIVGVTLYPWTKLFPTITTLPRWYAAPAAPPLVTHLPLV